MPSSCQTGARRDLVLQTDCAALETAASRAGPRRIPLSSHRKAIEAEEAQSYQTKECILPAQTRAPEGDIELFNRARSPDSR